MHHNKPIYGMEDIVTRWSHILLLALALSFTYTINI